MIASISKEKLEQHTDFVKYIDAAVAELPDDVLAAMRAGCKFEVFMDDKRIVFRSMHDIFILKDPKTGIILSLIEKRK